jgi:hypothetical protein|tara:strand:+ start:2796 stop:3221 length:426 start_codon:yes stop_codon:yes gene_type:complete
MINETLKLTGRVTVLLNDEVVQEIDNLVVTDGKGYVASRMKDATATVMSHMSVGTGSTAAAASDSALGAEAGRVALTSTSVTGAAVTYSASFPAGTGTGGLTEAAILNASSGGTMLCRTVFSVVNKQSADAMTIQWQVSAS